MISIFSFYYNPYPNVNKLLLFLQKNDEVVKYLTNGMTKINCCKSREANNFSAKREECGTLIARQWPTVANKLGIGTRL